MTPVLESITPEEQQALHQPEAVVRQDFIDVGEALLTIRDQRLYRDVQRTFGEDRSRTRPSRLESRHRI